MSDPLKVQIKKRIGVFLGLNWVRLIGASLRLEVTGAEKFENNDSKIIFCGWHGKSLIFANYFRRRKYWVIISNSNDGDIQNEVFTKMGYQTIRGSTGRGGVKAALQGVTALKDGGTMAITPDGPRGPSGEVQGGVMLMARKAGAALVPVGLSAQKAIYIKSWDKYMLPYPFSKARMVIGDPLMIPDGADDAAVEEVRLKLQSEINRLENIAATW